MKIVPMSEKKLNRQGQNTVSLIIRGWLEDKDGKAIWHFRVQDLRTNQQQGIAGKTALHELLDAYFEESDDTNPSK